MQSPNPVLSNPPQLIAQLKRRTDEFLSTIVRANYNTQFAQATPELAEFRQATADLITGMDNDSLSDVFRKSVPFTTYDAYAPFIAKFFEKPCKASSIANLLAPGLPDYLSHSSSTSGNLPKYFPKYDCYSPVATSDVGWWNVSDTNRRRTTLRLIYLVAGQMDVEDEENCPVKKIYMCAVSNIYSRHDLDLSFQRDEERMGTFVLDHAVPHAAAFIKKWRPFLFIHGLFAVANSSLETMSLLYISTFVDMIRCLDVDWDVVVNCIENGTIPTMDGVEEVRKYLEPNLLPDPERAAELRSFGRPSSRLGWCTLVWPKLRTLTTICSGSFATSIPLARSYLGPEIDICPRYYATTETSKLGLPYDPQESNMYKLSNRNIIEFLDVEKSSGSVSSLSQVWEVEVGKRYEIVVTNPDGLWRYRLGDVIEIAGFDPTDGTPIMKFIERRNMVMRFHNFMLSEEDLRAAMSSAISSMPRVNVFNWTTTKDERQLPGTVGFFVELANNEDSDLMSSAPDRVLDALLQINPNVAAALKAEFFRKPTVRLVRPGTFGEFHQLKVEEGSKNIGQLKVPVVLPKEKYVTWFSNQVVREL